MLRRALVLVLMCALLTVSATTVAAPLRAHGPRHVTSTSAVRETLTLSSGRDYDLQLLRSPRRPPPLIIMLTGVGQTVASLDASSDAYAFGRTHGLLIAYAHALRASHGTTAWNSGYCCAGQQADDLTYLGDIVNSVAAHTDVDRHRIYLVGMSNGGMMAIEALCRAPDLFTAAVSVAGPFLGSTCPRPAWLHLAGTADGIVPVLGGDEMWCGCVLPATTTEEQRFPGSTIQLMSGANHTWPRADDASWNSDGMSDAWNFLQAHRS